MSLGSGRLEVRDPTITIAILPNSNSLVKKPMPIDPIPVNLVNNQSWPKSHFFGASSTGKPDQSQQHGIWNSGLALAYARKFAEYTRVAL